MRKVVRGVGVVSVGKIALVIYAALGLLVGIVVAGLSSIGALAGLAAGESGMIGMFFGVGAIVVLPIFYAVIGALIWMLLAFLYNLIAGMMGGIELEVD
jgi:hypothetical protein